MNIIQAYGASLPRAQFKFERNLVTCRLIRIQFTAEVRVTQFFTLYFGFIGL